MKRKIISIDETKCTGCGQCIPDCPEGALQIIDGKARLVSDLFCDGLGACIGTCPEGAISVVEREAVPYDEKAVMETIVKQGAPVIRAHLEHLAGHGQIPFYNQAIGYLTEKGIPVPDHIGPDKSGTGKAAETGEAKGSGSAASVPGVCHPGPHGAHPFAGCPGAAARSIRRGRGPRQPVGGTTDSELRQWPIQLSLLHPSAPYFNNADLLISADCVPFACAGFHTELLKGKIVIIFCPKLDTDIEGYIEKLSQIFSLHTIRSITVVHMEVPCCSGVRYVVDQALEKSGKTIPVVDKTITIEGNIL
ncbi:ATP-binding protein [Methanoregula sp.]|uniref:ATP-binding protein n=1 Tax=Methanoregula sp. TaxID=2052170 RepID=UPI002B63D17B|nr:4Fe-4S binding protein [Methanoregula sp.]HVP96249.1 4Fe-4S binding protein [Methanoregula sp.]